jgi:hypothetical protein
MERRLLVSEYLTSQVGLYDMDGADQPSERDRIARSYLERVAETIIEAREAFTGDQFSVLGVSDCDWEKALQNEPEIVEEEMDRVLSCQLLQDVPAMVKRYIRLSKLNAVGFPSEQTAAYIREAAQVYAHGFFQASAAMSRAAVEQALKERLGIQGGGGRISFKDLVNRAETANVLDSAVAQQARDLAKEANTVLHERSTDEDRAYQVLIAARGLMQHVYSATKD